MKKIYLLLGLNVLAVLLTAQVNTDSLRKVWNNPALADTARLVALQEMAWSLLYSDPDSARTLAQQELEFARLKGNQRWQAKAFNVIASTYNVVGNYATALGYYQKGLKAMQEAGDLKGTAAISNNIGLVYRNMGNNPLALQYYQTDRSIQEALKDTGGIANAYNNLGTIYNDASNPSKALEYYQQSRQLMEKMNDRHGMAIAYNNIASVYNTQGKYREALEYYRKSLRLRQDQDDRVGVAMTYNNIGVVYNELGDFTQALSYYRKGMQLQETLGDQAGVATSCYFVGITLLNQQAYAEAVRICEKGLAISRQIGALRSERNLCNCLYKARKGLGQSRAALAQYEQYVALNDSLQKEETSQRLEQMEFAKQVMADSLGKEEEKLKVEMAHQQEVRQKNLVLNWLTVAGLVVLALALGFWSRMLYFRKYSQIFQNKAEYLEKQQLLNEIALLKTQVNPHFLFNSLSILSSLVHINPDLSEQFIDQLSRSYRYILEQKEQTAVTLRTELEFIQSYAFLLKIRFENKFDLRFQLPDAVLDQYKIAPLTLQLLVENAVKHNRMSVKEPLIVDVALEDDQFLVIKNRLQPRPASAASTGLGLQNIINRYALLTERTVWAGERKDEFVVKLPLLK